MEDGEENWGLWGWGGSLVGGAGERRANGKGMRSGRLGVGRDVRRREL